MMNVLPVHRFCLAMGDRKVSFERSYGSRKIENPWGLAQLAVHTLIRTFDVETKNGLTHLHV